jgi:hypothetical protein
MPVEYIFDGAALHPTDSSPNAVEKFSGTNVRRMVAGYSAALSPQRGASRILLPTDLDPAGTVTFAASFMMAGGTSGSVRLRFSHAPVAVGESYDQAYADVNSANISAGNTTNKFASWTATVASLDWSAEDVVYFRVERLTTLSPPVVGNGARLDLGMFRITVPTT